VAEFRFTRGKRRIAYLYRTEKIMKRMGMVPRVLNLIKKVVDSSFSPVELREEDEENGNGPKGVELGK
jgi:hypothetical protein